MAYWLMKSEPNEFSIDDLYSISDQQSSWTGVRNYQARNYIRDDMKPGDRAFFWHSSCAQPGIVGEIEIVSLPYADPTQFEMENPYYDPKATAEKPRWMCIDVAYRSHTPLITPTLLRANTVLREMIVLRRGNRLSVSPVLFQEWACIHHLWL
jgi:predicted RNA-binding protein with PUA-like domain